MFLILRFLSGLSECPRGRKSEMFKHKINILGDQLNDVFFFFIFERNIMGPFIFLMSMLLKLATLRAVSG